MKTLYALACLCLAPLVSSAGLRTGFAEKDITPEIGMEVPGGYGKAFAKRIHDPCKVRAVVFDDGKQRVAMVGLDALVVPQFLVLEARKLIQERCGIAPEAVMIGASHSHSSGPTGMVLPGDFDHASDLAKDLAYNKSSCADPKYLVTVRDAIVEAVVTADSARGEVTAGFGSGKEDTASLIL